MFADYVKMGAKAVALAVGVGAIVAFLASFQLPNLDLSSARSFLNTVYTIGDHYIPYFTVLWGLGVTLITLNVTLFGVKIALIATRWVLKINE